MKFFLKIMIIYAVYSSQHIKELSSSSQRQKKPRQSNDVYEICCNPNFACQDAYIGMTSQSLQHRPKQHCRSSYVGNDSAVFKHIIASGHQIDANDVTILDRGKLVWNWCESCMGQNKNPSLNCNGDTRITHSHSWNRNINTLRSFSPFPISSGRAQPEDNTNTSCHTTTTPKKTSGTSRTLVYGKFFALVTKNLTLKSITKQLFIKVVPWNG